MADHQALPSPEAAPDHPARRRKGLFWARAAFRRAHMLYARWTFLLACAVLAIGGFIALTSELSEGELDAFDSMVLQRIVEMRIPGLNGPAVDLTALGSVSVLTLLCVIAGALLLMHRDVLATWQLTIAACGGGLISTMLKRVLERARPAEVEKLV